MKTPIRISLKEYGGMKGLQDREDIIKYIVQKEDRAKGYVNEIPANLVIKDNLETPPWFVHAFSFDVGKYLMTFLP